MKIKLKESESKYNSFQKLIDEVKKKILESKNNEEE